MTLDEERKKLIDHLKGWQDCINTKCEDCSFSNPMGTKRVCTVMDAADLIDLALKIVKNDEILLKEQEPKYVNSIAQQISCFSGTCPKCGKMLNTTCNKNFCGECGQAVKW